MATGGLLNAVRHAVRARHYSPRTAQAYVRWVRRFVEFAGRRHPRALGETEVTAFLTDLAVRGRVSAATQNQALAALLFLYREVLGVRMGWLDGLVRAAPQMVLPVAGPLRYEARSNGFQLELVCRDTLGAVLMFDTQRPTWHVLRVRS